MQTDKTHIIDNSEYRFECIKFGPEIAGYIIVDIDIEDAGHLKEFHSGEKEILKNIFIREYPTNEHIDNKNEFASVKIFVFEGIYVSFRIFKKTKLNRKIFYNLEDAINYANNV